MIKNRTLTAGFLASTLALLANPTLVLANPINPPDPQPLGGITNPAIGDLGKDVGNSATSGTTFLNYFIVIWRGVIFIGGLMVIIYYLWGGIEWITAGGDAGKVSKARDKMMQVTMGLIILVGSFVIIGFISTLFFGDNFNLLRLTIPTPN